MAQGPPHGLRRHRRRHRRHTRYKSVVDESPVAILVLIIAATGHGDKARDKRVEAFLGEEAIGVVETAQVEAADEVAHTLRR
mmetsp:Transcript_66996/g.158088  ORF Transcript_66996/g.158088 Transcript_66996/m.158088 type:complete len:82 (+) Transcript_66996:283-528(+)